MTSPNTSLDPVFDANGESPSIFDLDVPGPIYPRRRAYPIHRLSRKSSKATLNKTSEAAAYSEPVDRITQRTLENRIHSASRLTYQLRRPPPNYRQYQRPRKPDPPQPEITENNINGSPTRKRRAETSELELVASLNDLNNFETRVFIARRGEIITTDTPDQAARAAQTRNPMRWKAAFIGFTRMILNIPSAISGISGSLSRLFHQRSYDIAECRAYIDENQISNKRVKLSHDESQHRWVESIGLRQLIDEYRAFALGINNVWETAVHYINTTEFNKILGPLSHALANSDGDRLALDHGKYELHEAFQLQFRRVFTFLDLIYSANSVVAIWKKYPTIPSVVEYDLSDPQIEQLEQIKRFLSAPALPTICNDILKLSGMRQTLLSESFFDKIVLDLEAIVHKLPMPSYVSSTEFHERLQKTFPRPQRTDLKTRLILPGSFPEFDEPEPEPTPQPEPEPEPTPLPASPIAQPDAELPRSEWMTPAIKSETFDHFDSTINKWHKDELKEVDTTQSRQKFRIEEEPLTLEENGKLRSILKHKRLSRSPKRLTQFHNIPKKSKVVRFTASTSDRPPKSGLALNITKNVDAIEATKPSEVDSSVAQSDWLKPRPDLWDQTNLRLQAHQNAASLALETERSETKEAEETQVLEEPEISEVASPAVAVKRVETESDKENIPPDYDAAIANVFAQPSPKHLLISDDSRAGIQHQKEQAALKAAEEARKKAEAERIAAEEQAKRELEERLAASGGLRLPARTFVTAVSADWQIRARDTLRAASSTTLATTAEGVDLRRHDFAKVVPPTEWLNDEIVNGSLNWLDQAINSAAGIKDVKRVTRKCLAMSSFFFKRLQGQGVTRTQRTLRRYGVGKENILDVNTILVPICEHSHWTLLVIRPSKRTIAHMDSLNPRGNPSYVNLGLAWMKDILEEKFVQDEWQTMRHESPGQTNGYDCGVHTITNAMCLALGLSPVDCYTAEDMPRQRIRIACMLLNGGFKDEFDLRVF